MEDKDNTRLEIISVEDVRTGGFTVYFENHPNVMAEGDTYKEAVKNLLNAHKDIDEYKEAIEAVAKAKSKEIFNC